MKRPNRVLHVGAHTAEELGDYLALGWGAESTVWIEALPEQCDIVRRRISLLPNHQVIQAVAWDQTGEEVTFNVSSNVESSSALEFADHLEVHPHVYVVKKMRMTTTALGELDIWSNDRDTFLNVDIQGAELLALKGIGEHIHKCAAIYCEVNLRELYRGVPLLNELDFFLESRGFTRVPEF